MTHPIQGEHVFSPFHPLTLSLLWYPIALGQPRIESSVGSDLINIQRFAGTGDGELVGRADLRRLNGFGMTIGKVGVEGAIMPGLHDLHLLTRKHSWDDIAIIRHRRLRRFAHRRQTDGRCIGEETVGKHGAVDRITGKGRGVGTGRSHQQGQLHGLGFGGTEGHLIVFDVGDDLPVEGSHTGAIEIGGEGHGLIIVLDIHQGGGGVLAIVADTGGLARLLSSLGKDGKKDSGKNGDNGYDDEQFDQRKAGTGTDIVCVDGATSWMILHRAARTARNLFSVGKEWLRVSSKTSHNGLDIPLKSPPYAKGFDNFRGKMLLPVEKRLKYTSPQNEEEA